MPILPFIPLIASGISAIGKGIKAGQQRKAARNLKESKYVPPELYADRDLASLQAFSRNAPGQAVAQENVRRRQATEIGAATRMYGGDANKMATILTRAGAKADDANRDIATIGEQFSNQAFNRLSGANRAIAGQKRVNRDEYNRAKSQLISASDQNWFGAFNDLLNGGLATASFYGGGGGGGSMNIGARRMGYRGDDGSGSPLYMNQYNDYYGTPA